MTVVAEDDGALELVEQRRGRSVESLSAITISTPNGRAGQGLGDGFEAGEGEFRLVEQDEQDGDVRRFRVRQAERGRAVEEGGEAGAQDGAQRLLERGGGGDFGFLRGLGGGRRFGDGLRARPGRRQQFRPQRDAAAALQARTAKRRGLVTFHEVELVKALMISLAFARTALGLRQPDCPARSAVRIELADGGLVAGLHLGADAALLGDQPALVLDFVDELDGLGVARVDQPVAHCDRFRAPRDDVAHRGDRRLLGGVDLALVGEQGLLPGETVLVRLFARGKGAGLFLLARGAAWASVGGGGAGLGGGDAFAQGFDFDLALERLAAGGDAAAERAGRVAVHGE